MEFGSWSAGSMVKTGKGKLTFEDNIECPVCYEIATGVSYPRCDHMICVSCFKRFFYQEGNTKLETLMAEHADPPFPYPDQEDEYFEASGDHPLKSDPKVVEWGRQCEKMEDRRSDIYVTFLDQEKNLRVCALCRK
jgi:hypothetical protein